MKIEEMCSELRVNVRDLGDLVRALMDDDFFKNEQMYTGQHGEMKANIMLAFRHLEDARMRLGKVIQAYDGGTSVYDK